MLTLIPSLLSLLPAGLLMIWLWKPGQMAAHLAAQS
jgi:hypothetical protein